MHVTIYANFPDAANCEKALGALLDRGAQPIDLSAFFPSEYETPDVHEVASNVRHGVTTTTKEDAKQGARKGAGYGLGVGTLAALVSLAIPGFGLVTGGGALATALGSVAGSTVGGALTGGVAGFLEDQGITTRVASDSDAALRNGEAVLVVKAPTGHLTEEQASELLLKYHGQIFGRVEQPITTGS
jgi:hypothetical protein